MTKTASKKVAMPKKGDTLTFWGKKRLGTLCKTTDCWCIGENHVLRMAGKRVKVTGVVASSNLKEALWVVTLRKTDDNWQFYWPFYMFKSLTKKASK
jgi:hypothetical protein